MRTRIESRKRQGAWYMDGGAQQHRVTAHTRDRAKKVTKEDSTELIGRRPLVDGRPRELRFDAVDRRPSHRRVASTGYTVTDDPSAASCSSIGVLHT